MWAARGRDLQVWRYLHAENTASALSLCNDTELIVSYKPKQFGGTCALAFVVASPTAWIIQLSSLSTAPSDTANNNDTDDDDVGNNEQR